MLILLSVTSGYSQNYRINERSRLYTEEISTDSLLVKADNYFAVPLSLKLKLELANLESIDGTEISAVLQPLAKGQVVARLRKTDPDEEFRCKYDWRMVMGDVTRSPDSYKYAFPFTNGGVFPVSQGPGESFSHHNSFAYDFAMPAGSPVTAARAGIVAFVDTKFSEGGPYNELLDKANVISVLHADGTIANYVHLNRNGSLVKEGESVKAGQLIGFSGNTGYSTGAHLHFEVIQPSHDSTDKKWIKFDWDRSLYSLEHSSPALAAKGAGKE